MSDNEPILRAAYSREEITRKACEWMIAECGSPKGKSQEERDYYHERLGLLVSFLSDTFPSSIGGRP